VYNVQVEYGRRSLSAYAIVSVVFTSCPTQTALLVKEAVEVLEALHKNEPTAQDVDTICQVQRNHHASALQNPSAWLFWLLDSCKQVAAVKRAQVGATAPAVAVAMATSRSGDDLSKSMLLRATNHFELIDSLTPQKLQVCHTSQPASPALENLNSSSATKPNQIEYCQPCF
jgi:hypothetical protein